MAYLLFTVFLGVMIKNISCLHSHFCNEKMFTKYSGCLSFAKNCSFSRVIAKIKRTKCVFAVNFIVFKKVFTVLR